MRAQLARSSMSSLAQWTQRCSSHDGNCGAAPSMSRMHWAAPSVSSSMSPFRYMDKFSKCKRLFTLVPHHVLPRKHIKDIGPESVPGIPCHHLATIRQHVVFCGGIRCRKANVIWAQPDAAHVRKSLAVMSGTLRQQQLEECNKVEPLEDDLHLFQPGG